MNGDHVLMYSGVDEDKRAAAGVGCIIPVSYTHLDVYKRQQYLEVNVQTSEVYKIGEKCG